MADFFSYFNRAVILCLFRILDFHNGVVVLENDCGVWTKTKCYPFVVLSFTLILHCVFEQKKKKKYFIVSLKSLFIFSSNVT
jgi:hypothetical protein